MTIRDVIIMVLGAALIAGLLVWDYSPVAPSSTEILARVSPPLTSSDPRVLLRPRPHVKMLPPRRPYKCPLTPLNIKPMVN